MFLFLNLIYFLFKYWHIYNKMSNKYIKLQKKNGIY